VITNLHARFKVITAKILKIPALCDETPCILVTNFFYFGVKVRPPSACWGINTTRKFFLSFAVQTKETDATKTLGIYIRLH